MCKHEIIETQFNKDDISVFCLECSRVIDTFPNETNPEEDTQHPWWSAIEEEATCSSATTAP